MQVHSQSTLSESVCSIYSTTASGWMDQSFRTNTIWNQHEICRSQNDRLRRSHSGRNSELQRQCGKSHGNFPKRLLSWRSFTMASVAHPSSDKERHRSNPRKELNDNLCGEQNSNSFLDQQTRTILILSSIASALHCCAPRVSLHFH